MVRGIAIGVALLRFRPNGAKCDSLGQRPRKRQSKNQSPNGAKPTVLHRVVPPRWGFVDWVAPSTQGDALGFHLVGLWPGTAWCVESQSALHSCDSAPNGAKCDSLGQRPRKRQSKNQSPNGAEPTVLHRVVPPHWGFSTGWPRTPRAMPWAFTLWAFGPESHCA